jgi:hypothetical protein
MSSIVRARSQQSDPVRKIGILMPFRPTNETHK